MFFIKFIIYILIFCLCTYIGFLISKQYKNRVTELNELKIALNILKTKIRFTNETLKDIFDDIAKNSKGNVSNFFKEISLKLKCNTAQYAWETSLDNSFLRLKDEDRQALKSMGKLLGKTDLEGQLKEIELTENFLETQIIDAKNEREKNEKLYKTLGMASGLGIVIILL